MRKKVNLMALDTLNIRIQNKLKASTFSVEFKALIILSPIFFVQFVSDL